MNKILDFICKHFRQIYFLLNIFDCNYFFLFFIFIIKQKMFNPDIKFCTFITIF